MFWSCRRSFVSRGQSLFQEKGGNPYRKPPSVLHKYRLFAEAKLLDDSSVSLDVLLLEVIKKTASLTDKFEQRKTCDMVFLVAFTSRKSPASFQPVNIQPFCKKINELIKFYCIFALPGKQAGAKLHIKSDYTNCPTIIFI